MFEVRNATSNNDFVSARNESTSMIISIFDQFKRQFLRCVRIDVKTKNPFQFMVTTNQQDFLFRFHFYVGMSLGQNFSARA